jgi:hypothetical protein
VSSSDIDADGDASPREGAKDADAATPAADGSVDTPPGRGAAAIRAFAFNAPGDGSGAPPAQPSQRNASASRESDAFEEDQQAVAGEADEAAGGVRDTATAQGFSPHGGQGRARHGLGPDGAQERESGARPAAPALPPGLAATRSPEGTLPAAFELRSPEAGAAMTPQERSENVARLVQSMRVFTRDGVSEATVHLRPDHLGPVRIVIRVEGKSVVATVHAESASVREWLESQEGALRAGLSEQGLDLDRLVVHRDPRHQHREPPPDPPRLRPRRDTSTEERFVVSA